MNYFQGNKDHPRHLSVGAVLMNEKGEICAHYLSENINGYWKDEGLVGTHILMRETVEHNESLEQAVERGLMEEFGATAEIKDYIGSIQSHFKDEEVEGEKITLYFLCNLIDQNQSRRDTSDVEGQTDLEWHPLDFLIEKMRKQGLDHPERTDMDESSILERLKQLLG